MGKANISGIELLHHFNNIENAIVKTDPSIYIQSWLFVRKLIEKAFDVDLMNDLDKNNINVDIIDKYIINDILLKSELHEIRKYRNSYEHGSMSDIPDPGNELISSLNRLINYVNDPLNQSKDNYRFRKSFSDETRRGIVFECEGHRSKTSNSHGIFNPTDFKKLEKLYYSFAYDEELSYFSFPYPQDGFRTKIPHFAVIHNILIRNETIVESSYLRSQVLTKDDLKIIYIYQILILHKLSKLDEFNIKLLIGVKRSHIKHIEIAIKDIRYYLHILIQMGAAIVDLDAKIIEQDFTITDKDKIIISLNNSIETAQLESIDNVFAHGDSINSMAKVFIGEKISYKINENSVIFFNMLLNETFGLPAFKQGQIAALKSILDNKKNHLIVLPTGYGKSLIYQFLSVIQPCITIIVSANSQLIHDQIENLKDLGFTRVREVTKNDRVLSSFIVEKNGYIYNNMINPKSLEYGSTIFYTTPYDIQSEIVVKLLSALEKSSLLNIIAIDECHQMSIWGHKFEAEYFTLVRQIALSLKKTQFILFSGTSSRKVKEDLKTQFVDNPPIVLQPCPLDRGHIHYEFIEKNNVYEIIEDIALRYEAAYGEGGLFDLSDSRELPVLNIILNNDESILRKIYDTLLNNSLIGPTCSLYFGQENVYRRFRAANKRLIITNDAFLTGINVPFLRNIIIIGYPPSKEWFYQQTGRIGRAGEDSNVITYIFKKESEMLSSLLADDYINFNKSLRSLKVNNKIPEDLSNLQALTTFVFKDENLKKTIEIFSEIQKFTFYPISEDLGKVSGTMLVSDKKNYDFPLFLLYYMKVIEKWLFKFSETNNIKYRYYINPEIENGTIYYESYLLNCVQYSSSNNEIASETIRKIKIVNDDFNRLIEIVLDWFLKNTFYSKQQMLINIIQMINSNKGSISNDAGIENELNMYFGVDSDEYYLIESKTTIIDPIKNLINKIQNKSMIEIINKKSVKTHEDKKIIEKTLHSESGIKPVDQRRSEEITIGKDSNEGSCVVASGNNDQSETPAAIETDNHESLEIANSDEIALVLQEESTLRDNDETVVDPVDSVKRKKSNDKFHGLIKQMKSSDNTSHELLENIIKYAVMNDSSEELISFRAHLERELEDYYHLNIELAIVILEVLNENSNVIVRTKKILGTAEFYQIGLLLNELSPYLDSKKKRMLDSLLKGKGKNPFFYKGILGKLQLLVDIFKD